MSFVKPCDLNQQPRWRHSLLAPQAWKRGACYGLPAGFIQVVVNQGDYWMAGHVTTPVVVKTVISPLVGFAVAYIAAVTTHYEAARHRAVTFTQS